MLQIVMSMKYTHTLIHMIPGILQNIFNFRVPDQLRLTRQSVRDIGLLKCTC